MYDPISSSQFIEFSNILLLTIKTFHYFAKKKELKLFNIYL